MTHVYATRGVPRALETLGAWVLGVLWLLPLLAVLLTSVRSSAELVQGNYWGWPREFGAWDNYRTVLLDSPMLHYAWNSCLITFPSVLGAIVLSAMAGFALATVLGWTGVPAAVAAVFSGMAAAALVFALSVVPGRSTGLASAEPQPKN